MKDRLLTLLFIFIGIAAILIIVLGGRPVWEGLAAKNWPTTEATVTSSEVGIGTSYHRAAYRLHVTYGYRVSGVEYTSDRLTVFPRFTRSKEAAEKRLLAFAPGRHIRIFYNAADPGAAVFSPGIVTADWTFVALGLLLLLLPALFFLRRQPKEPSPASLLRGTSEG
jgi:hypothetical protein